MRNAGIRVSLAVVGLIQSGHASLLKVPGRCVRVAAAARAVFGSGWHFGSTGPLGSPTHADAILDRLAHYACRVALRGESMRKFNAKGEGQPIES